MTKIYWKVSEVPTGRFRSFEKRSWPDGYWDKGHNKSAVMLSCEDSYAPHLIKSGEHKEITIYVAKWFDREGKAQSFKWVKLNLRAKTLAEAKAFTLRFFDEHPNWEGIPKEINNA